MEMMKERFAKLLLGEDMSGGGQGVSSALALSNAITNLAGDFHKNVIKHYPDFVQMFRYMEKLLLTLSVCKTYSFCFWRTKEIGANV